MTRNFLRPLQYLIGFSFALIAVSNCFNVLSDSSFFIGAPFAGVSRAEARKPELRKLDSLPSISSGGSLFINPTSKPSTSSFATRLLRASAASPASPIITATKSSLLPMGDTQANPGDTLTYSVVISNSGTADALGVNFTDTIDANTTLVPGSVMASPVAVDDGYNTIGNVHISVPSGQGVIANDLNANGSGTLEVTLVNATAVPGTAATTNGSVTMASDGSFTYTPNAGF